MEIKGKNVLITGSANRVGKEIALSLAKEGANIIIHYFKSGSQAKQTLKELKEYNISSKAIKADFNKIADIRSMVNASIETMGSIDVLINCASVFYKTPINELEESHWDDIFNINLKGNFFCCKYAGLHMVKRGFGKIINISDVGGIILWKDYIAYCISKSAIIAMTKALAKEFSPYVLVNAIAPGTILPPDNMNSQAIEKLKEYTLIKKIGSPFDINECIKFIIKSDYITGSIFIIDGGELVNR